MRGVQTYRNPKLVHLFDKLNLIENFGTGIPRTFEAYRNTGKEPVFDSSERNFFVTLPNLNYGNNDQINDQINDLGLLILKQIKMNPRIKVPDLVKNISTDIPSINADKIRNEIKRELKNYIEIKGSRKTGDYYLKTQK